MSATHILFESSSGYAIFQAKQVEEIATKAKSVQDSIQDLHKFGKMVELKSFLPFKSAAHALENINDVSEGVLNDYLKEMLELVLASSKKTTVVLGISDKTLASSINGTLGISCDTSPRSLELIRGVRLHAEKLLGGLQTGDLTKAQLGLGHSYSRSKVKFNVNRSDNMIIQAIALLDQMDKDVNTFSMRIREWFGYHFPEMSKLVSDNLMFAKVAQYLVTRASLEDEEKFEGLVEIVDGDETLAKNLRDAARSSMGSDLNEIDSININAFARRVVSLAEYRKELISYLSAKMNIVAPSLTSLIGERIGARLISHAGSLTNLSKYPASTVQILGAEKALFRALKTKGNTPKYGLIYHSTFIGRAGAKHKGRISRFLANKCSIASRIDCYSDVPNNKFGEALRGQVEERLNFFETGTAPSKNSDTMKKVLADLALLGDDGGDGSDAEMADAAPIKTPSKKDKKRKAEAMEVDSDEETEEARKARKAAKKAAKAAAKSAEADGEPVKTKKSKKDKTAEVDGEQRESKKRRKSKAE